MNDDVMIPYVVVKFSNGDIVLAEFVEETFTALLVRNAIQIRTAYVTNEHGVKVKKKMSSIYCELAHKSEIVIQKPSCNYIAPIRYPDRKYYEVLVAYHFNKKKDDMFNFDSDDTDGKQEETTNKENDSKPIIH